jgi:hypothetical protein
MNIQGMDLPAISKKILPYLTKYFNGCELLLSENGFFSESYLLGYDEIEHLIPEKHKYYFKNTDFINGASGIVNFSNQAKRFNGHEYIVMLLSNEDYSKALFLYLQCNNASSNAQINILVADFMSENQYKDDSKWLILHKKSKLI